ncbi:MAG: hypothetical protein AAGD40_03115 [Pseudomonadota bacterium]
MRIFTLIVYVILGLLIAWFSSQNFERVTMWLPGGYEANWPFAVYLIVALLLGALPLSIMHSISRWRWRRRVRRLEAALVDRSVPGTIHDGRAVAEPAAPLPPV